MMMNVKGKMSRGSPQVKTEHNGMKSFLKEHSYFCVAVFSRINVSSNELFLKDVIRGKNRSKFAEKKE